MADTWNIIFVMIKECGDTMVEGGLVGDQTKMEEAMKALRHMSNDTINVEKQSSMYGRSKACSLKMT